MNSVSRLVRSFAPEHYELSLTLEREARRFSGIVTIRGTVAVGASDIRLHAKELDIQSVTYDGHAASWSFDKNDEVAITSNLLADGNHVLVIAFTGTITDPMHGLYPCYYEHNGEKKELLATQFESHYAREVFPCVDEPEAKATFDLTLTTEDGITVLGNMPIKLQRTENDRLVTSFQTTPRMSTYLLAWVAGDLQKRTAQTKNDVEVNIWATPAQPARSLDFALGIATRTIDFFDDYFGVPYPLPKSDHVALPDFSAAAMENWGLVTYREVALLADPGVTSLADQHDAATVISHELSHQWFGNLVTMKWWNDLWLNESFATMMQFVSIDALEPSWQVWLDNASSEVLSALRRDALDGVQAVQTDVNHPDEIGTLFDPSIVYAKGGRLLRMLQAYIGDEALQQGLSRYFTTHKYGNTEASDLWKSLSETSGKDINAFMSTWLTKPGYPVIHVTQDGDTVTLRQERFFIGPHEPSDTTWQVPLHSSCGEMPAILDEKEVSIKRSHTSLLTFNQGATSHFITHYDEALTQRILDSLSTLPTIDRLYFLHEQTLLAQAGIISSAQLISVLQAFKDETQEAVWSIMALAINELKRFVETDEAAEKKLRQFVGGLAMKQYEKLGLKAAPGEPDTHTKLRHIITSLMLYSEHETVLDEVENMYQATPLQELDPELRPSILASVVRRHSTPTIIDDLLDAYKDAIHSGLRDDIAAGLTSTKDEAVIARLSDVIKDSDTIRPQDFIHWFIWLLRNRYGRTFMWQWTRDNWQWLYDNFSTDAHYDSFPRYIASSLVTRKELDEFSSFFLTLKDQVALKRNIEVGETELQGRVALLERDGEAVRQALLDL